MFYTVDLRFLQVESYYNSNYKHFENSNTEFSDNFEYLHHIIRTIYPQYSVDAEYTFILVTIIKLTSNVSIESCSSIFVYQNLTKINHQLVKALLPEHYDK